MDDTQQRRLALNEARFRDANERIRSAVDAHDGAVEPYPMMCECAVTECADTVELTPAEYEHVRSHPAWFAVRPDHVFPVVERVVERFDAYWIVEKVEAGREVAEQRDPR